MDRLTLQCSAAAATSALLLLAFPASGWEFTYLNVDVAGYAYAGGVWPDGRFPTNLVAVPANTLTNLGSRARGATATNELLIQLGSNSIAGQQVFDLESGCRACFLARGGLLVREIMFRLDPTSGETENAPVPLRLTLQSFPTNSGLNSYYSNAQVWFSMCEWTDDQASCTDLVSAVVASSNTEGLRGFTNDLTLRIGRQYRLTCTLTADTGLNGEIPTFNDGMNSFSLQKSVLLAIGMSQGQARIRVKGQPGGCYVLERSSDLTAWNPVTTNTPPGGTFEYVDENAANQPSRFYRAVEKR